MFHFVALIIKLSISPYLLLKPSHKSYTQKKTLYFSEFCKIFTNFLNGLNSLSLINEKVNWNKWRNIFENKINLSVELKTPRDIEAASHNYTGTPTIQSTILSKLCLFPPTLCFLHMPETYFVSKLWATSTCQNTGIFPYSQYSFMSL